jgi:hypothetical protein
LLSVFQGWVNVQVELAVSQAVDAAKALRQQTVTVSVADTRTPAIMHPDAGLTPGFAITALPVTIPVTVTLSQRQIPAASESGS